MTAIAIITAPDRMWIASDGAAYTEPDGILRHIAPKVVLCPDWDCVISSRGMGLAAEAMRMRGLRHNARDFDELVENASELAEVAEADLSLSARGVTHHFTLILSGYSRSRRTFETHTVRTRPGPGWDADAGRIVELPPFDVSRQPALLLLPEPAEEIAAHFGLELPRGQANFQLTNPEMYVQQAVMACRYCPSRLPESPEDAPVHGCVGGFVQVTRMSVHLPPAPPDQQPSGEPLVMMDTAITHRRPDIIGEPIDMERGSLPPWALAPRPDSIAT